MSDNGLTSRIKGIIRIFSGILIFTALLPLMVTTIADAGATGTIATLLDYMPLFLGLGILLWIIAWAIGKVSGGALLTVLVDSRSLVGVIIVEVVGIIFFPLVSTQVDAANTTLYAQNMTQAASIVNQIPLFYALALLFIAIGFGLKATGKI